MKPIIFLALLLIMVSEASGNSYQGKNYPKGRYGHRMTYDAARRMAVVFGGRGEGKESLGDTWGWNGNHWKQLDSTGPSPRAFHAMAYDEARRVIVLFGGRDASQKALNDTWEWNGKQWRAIKTAGPSARDHHAMTYDAVRGKVVLFGGFNGSDAIFADTWEWDGKTWSLILTSGPSARSSHQLIFDPQRRSTILFGGRCRLADSYTCGDTWEWDGKRWQKIAELENGGRSHFGMSYVPECNCYIRFGGGNSERTPFGDTWKFSENKWKQIETDSPQIRVDLAMTYDYKRKQVVLFGGYVPTDEGSIFADTWIWNGNFWEQRLAPTDHKR